MSQPGVLVTGSPVGKEASTTLGRRVQSLRCGRRNGFYEERLMSKDEDVVNLVRTLKTLNDYTSEYEGF